MRRATITRSVGAAIAAAGLLVALLLAPAPARAAEVQRGVADNFILSWPVADQDLAVAELGDKLHAGVFRIDLLWDLAEPSRGAYADDGYLASVLRLVDAAHARGMRVVVTVYRTPRWASDSSWWNNPPPTYATGYHSFFPMDAAALPDWERFAEHLATLLNGEVFAYECWNEPNLWAFLYPQQANGDGYFAIHTYLTYLERFHAGIKAGDPAALVVAGATAPGGSTDKYRTAPQRFAKVLKNIGAADYFDAYSHHPYTVGGSSGVDPAAAPTNKSIVTLANISTLLDIFPTKPFYLTEYGYNTEYTYSFGTTVSEIDQASYLKKAYAMAARHPQIEMLLWYLLRDWSPKGDRYDAAGLYTGLRGLGGGTKRAWFAFAGGNHLTLECASRRPTGSSLRLQGALSSDAVGGLKGRPLIVQRQRGHNPWKTIRKITTTDDGNYKTFVVLSRTARYRLVWQGVVTSPSRVVRAV